jgi:hypothetical protein
LTEFTFQVATRTGPTVAALADIAYPVRPLSAGHLGYRARAGRKMTGRLMSGSGGRLRRSE